MSKIIDKRNSLERFIREQTLGPGISGYRYVDLDDEVLLNKRLQKEEPINYSSEILDIVPAAIYSTGILFPEDKSGTCKEGISLDNNEQTDQEDDADEQDSQNNSSDDIEETESVELNQMFPRTMGLTCCLDSRFLEKGIIEFKVCFRYYQKLMQDKEAKFNLKYGLLCEINHEEIQKFINKFELKSFKIKSVNDNWFLSLDKLSDDERKLMRAKISDVLIILSRTLFDKVSNVVHIPNLKREKCYLSNLKSSIFYELKNTITDDDKR